MPYADQYGSIKINLSILVPMLIRKRFGLHLHHAMSCVRAFSDFQPWFSTDKSQVRWFDPVIAPKAVEL